MTSTSPLDPLDPRDPEQGEKRPLDVALDLALDLFVYAPVGLALSAKELLPELAQRGRRQVTGQVEAARIVGRFVVAQGQARAAQVFGSSPGVADELAVPGYDSLPASQVVPRLAGLSGAELEAVRRYEVAHRARKTILGRIAQLQA